jgi:hypothetical protein
MTDESAKVAVPPEVLRGIEAVRKSGRTNMLARDVVAAIALELGYVGAAFWLNDKTNHKAYAQGIFNGFEEAETPTT